MTISSYVLSLNRDNEYTWTSELKYHIHFKWPTGFPGKTIENWIYHNVATLPFTGKHKQIEWNQAGFAVDNEEDLTLLLCSVGEHVKFVIDCNTSEVIYGSLVSSFDK